MAVRITTSVAWSAIACKITWRVAKLTGVLVLLDEELVDALANLVVGDLDVVLGGAVVKHEGEETVVSNVELVLC
jgi:hypothetical protein